jgi:pimeloyl-ACP methyl ester carboxylesterase
MRRALKIAGVVMASLVGLAGIVIAAALAYRAYCQHENRLALRITSPHGIDTAAFVDIGGLPQWIQIRGEDRANPVLLFIHGGPAVSMIPFTFRSMRSWEKYFTLVQWDQRGAGRTYFRNGGADSTSTGMSQIIDDGLRVSQYAASQLGKRKIIVMGESWGSAIALEMVRTRPDLFYAFVGTGQAVDMPRAEVLTYRLLLDSVRARHDEQAVKQLLAPGPPPYATTEPLTIEQRVLGQELNRIEDSGRLGRDFLLAPGYSLRECLGLLGGATRHRSVLVRDDEKYSALARGSQFSIPLFFIEGTDDIQAPAQLVSEYVGQITAPRKELMLIQGGGHNAFYFFGDRFLHELLVRVRPLAL